MFYISKLFTFFFLPPGIFILIAAALIVLSITKKRKSVFILLVIQLALLYVSSITPVQNALLLQLENAYPPLLEGPLTDLMSQENRNASTKEGGHDKDTATPPTAEGNKHGRYPNAGKPSSIVVLGGGMIPSSPAEAGKGAPTGPALKRLVHGYYLYRWTGLPLVLSSGSVYRGKHSEPEAVAAKRVLIKMGMPEEDILTETESRNTWENARNTAEIIGDESEGKSVVLVTSAFHMKRAVLSFEKFGVPVVPAPTDYRTIRVPYTVVDYLPSIGDLKNFYIAVHEYIGLFYYGLKRGTK